MQGRVKTASADQVCGSRNTADLRMMQPLRWITSAGGWLLLPTLGLLLSDYQYLHREIDR